MNVWQQAWLLSGVAAIIVYLYTRKFRSPVNFRTLCATLVFFPPLFQVYSSSASYVYLFDFLYAICIPAFFLWIFDKQHQRSALWVTAFVILLTIGFIFPAAKAFFYGDNGDILLAAINGYRFMGQVACVVVLGKEIHRNRVAIMRIVMAGSVLIFAAMLLKRFFNFDTDLYEIMDTNLEIRSGQGLYFVFGLFKANIGYYCFVSGVLAITLRKDTWPQVVFDCVCLLCAASCIVLAVARTSLLVLSVSGLVGLAIAGRRYLLQTRNLAFLAGVLILVPPVTLLISDLQEQYWGYIIRTLQNDDESMNTFDFRRETWAATLEDMQLDERIAGVMHRPPEDMYSPMNLPYHHNEYMAVFYFTGAIGLLTYLGCLAALIRAAWLRCEPEMKPVIAAIIVGALIHGSVVNLIFPSILFGHVNLVMLVILVACCRASPSSLGSGFGSRQKISGHSSREYSL